MCVCVCMHAVHMQLPQRLHKISCQVHREASTGKGTEAGGTSDRALAARSYAESWSKLFLILLMHIYNSH